LGLGKTGKAVLWPFKGTVKEKPVADGVISIGYSKFNV